MQQALPPKLERERQTVAAMVALSCRGRHRSGPGLCEACRDLLTFAEFRLQRCPHGPDKPTCARCPVHCYKPDRRAQIREVMRHAGPRMLWSHPVLTLRHWLDGFRKASPKHTAVRT